MALETRQYAITIPAGTTVASAFRSQLTMPARVVRRIRVRVPPGPSGLMGWRLGSGTVQVIPWNVGSWFVWDDESDVFLPDGQIDSGAWELQGYNLGSYSHTVYLTFDMDPPQVMAAGLPWTYDGSLLGGGGSTSPDPAAPPPSTAATFADGYAVAKQNALAVVGGIPGDGGSPALAPVPAAPGPAADGYDAGKSAALAALQAIQTAVTVPDVPTGDGYAIARVRALAAIHGAYGDHVTGTVPAAPAVGSPLRSDYDRGQRAAEAAVRRIT